jgi:hypothetical protein
MQGTSQQRGARRTRGGCPPVLEIDLTQTDRLGPTVEWPEGPPTRRSHTTRRADAPISELTTGRAVQLLDAAVAHLRTALETTTDPEEATRIEDAIADSSRALEHLQALRATD